MTKALTAQIRWELLRNLRNRRFIFFVVLLPLGFYLLYVNLMGGNMKIGTISWSAYYMISMASFGCVGGGLNGLSSRIAFERTQGWTKLIQTTPLSEGSYLIGKITSQVVLNAVEVIIIFLAGAMVEGVHFAAWQWIAMFLWFVIGGIPFITLGILIGILAGSEAAQVISAGAYFILSILGGLWFPVTIMPRVMKNIAHWMPTYRFADVNWQLQSGHGVSASDISVLAVYFVVFAGLTLWLMQSRREVSFD